jgi:putative membrane protein
MIEQTPTRADSRVNMAPDQTSMASLRTKLALDRTTLAWIRTALTMASFGFGMVAFFRSTELQSPSDRAARLYHGAIRVGAALLVLGIVAMVLAGASHWITLRKLRRGGSLAFSGWPLSITLAMLSAVLGLLALWAAFAP